mmetsp:Transcript_34650/g.107146  ORF Transcript_34650/g.107146 Transcript_34650/m.107146 type:complete len:269 (+) Transcript_34650:262-1068(+)
MAEPAPKKHKALDASVQAYIDTNEGTANFWLLAGATGSDDLQQIKLPTCRAFVAFHSKLIRDLPDEEDPEFPVLCDHDTSTLVLFLQACQPNFCGLPEYSAGDIGKLSKIAHYFDAPTLVDCLFDQLIKLLQKSDNNNAFTWTSELYEAVFVMKDLGKKFVLLDPSDLDPRARRSPGGFEIQFAPPHHEHGAALRIHNNFFVIQFPRVFLELDEAARSTLKKHSRSLISSFITRYREGKYGSGIYSEAVKASMLSCLYFVLAEATSKT